MSQGRCSKFWQCKNKGPFRYVGCVDVNTCKLRWLVSQKPSKNHSQAVINGVDSHRYEPSPLSNFFHFAKLVSTINVSVPQTTLLENTSPPCAIILRQPIRTAPISSLNCRGKPTTPFVSHRSPALRNPDQ